jgi:protein-disulfide isomerase
MPPQSQGEKAPTSSRRSNEDRRATGRAQRKAAAEQEAKRKRLILVGGAIAAAVVVALVLILVNRPQSAGAPIVAAAPLSESIPVDGRTMGNPDALVSVVEWGDYQCPGCGIFAREVEPRLIEEYVTPGDITFEFRDFSFLGPESFRAAEAAACAADQNAFWRFHETIYLNQRGENMNAFSDDRLKQMAQDLSLDTAAFNACLDSGEKRAAVDASAAAAREEGITSTPSIFINGTKIDDWRNWETVSQAIDAALAQE